jgi:flagellin
MKVNVRTMAKEMMEFTKNNILSQAAQSMLAQSQQILSQFYNYLGNLMEGRLIW